jgi:putative flavoprotein involved in K+ transport
MSVEKVDTLIVGGGQAGVAMSEHLLACGVSHVVLERHRIAERWRTERWDSLVANGPAWHDCFPGMGFPTDPDAFPSKDQVADYFTAYAKMIDAPIRCGVDVTLVERKKGRPGFRVETSAGLFEANNVVAATGPFQTPIMPDLVPASEGILQIHSSAYRNPQQLPPGGVMVVGAGSSGTQIADELRRAGRKVYLSLGPHGRPPRSYRNRDFCWWLGVLGKWDIESTGPDMEHVTIAVSGSRGGQTVDFRRFAGEGICLVGRTETFRDSALTFAADLASNIARGDANYLALLDEADSFVADNGLDLPEEPAARKTWPDPECLTNPVRSLNLREAGVETIIWATGFTADYKWLKVDAFDSKGRPKHLRGVSAVPGIYFLGLPWQSRRGSSFIWGVWHDAKYLADRISTQQKYRSYQAAVNREVENA